MSLKVASYAYWVSILVLLDDAYRPGQSIILPMAGKEVSILVLLDDAYRLHGRGDKVPKYYGFNPCSSG